MTKVEIPDGLCDSLQKRFGGVIKFTGCRRDADFWLTDIPSEVSDGIIDYAVLDYYSSWWNRGFSVECVRGCFQVSFNYSPLLIVSITNDTKDHRRILVMTLFSPPTTVSNQSA